MGSVPATRGLSPRLLPLKTQAEAEALKEKLAVSDRIRLGVRPLHRSALTVEAGEDGWTVKARYDYTGFSLFFR